MKLQIKKSYFLFALVFIVLVSCRTEDDLSIDPPTNETIKPNSTLANLMSRVAKKDGSKDNIIDKASNLTVQLPVTVMVNGIELEIIDEDGYEDIEDIIDFSEDDVDSVVIMYPIITISSDFSTNVVNSDTELLALTVNAENDDDIECLDFQYPITLSYFDEINEIFATLTINNDNEIFDFIEDLDQFAAVTFNFPFAVLFSDDTSQIINNIQELEAVIEATDNTCDEDDDNDFDDDDDEQNCGSCSVNELENAFEDCTEWSIDKLKRDNTNLVSIYTDYMFTFNSDGTILVTEDVNTYSGIWVITEVGDDIFLTIQVDDLPDFNDTWEVRNINLAPVEKKIELKLGTDRLRFGSYCIND
ncbi:MAG: hypothetical protein AB8B52_08115 [Winogradskyella sp.]|uniref:hypothetical protein n=1 Tax=Winogradskyella sp. TaxID=1883156 RepID=UPI00385F9FA1